MQTVQTVQKISSEYRFGILFSRAAAKVFLVLLLYVRYSNAQARQEMRKLRSTESVINHYLDWCPVTLLDMK